MRTSQDSAFFLLCVVATMVSLLGAGRVVQAEESPKLGFSLTDLGGRIHRLEPSSEVQAWAIVFLSTECPIARGYVPTFNRLAEDARKPGSGVTFLGVLSDPTVSRAAAKQFAEEFAIGFPILFDASGQLASVLKPTHVPEAFVLDQQLRVAYRGRVDDLYAQIGKRRPEPTEHDFRDAIQAVSTGGVPTSPRTKAVGCLFESWESRGGNEYKPTYARDIAPLVQANCLVCHRTGEVAPFSLANYEDVAKRAEQIAGVVQSREMPPWMPEAGHGAFLGERGLTSFEQQLFADWAASGATEGHADDLPAAPSFVAGWRLGEPDLIVSMPEPFEVPAEGPDLFQNFVIPLDVPEDKLVAAVDVRPGCKSVVHHLVLFLDANGNARKLDAKTPEQGYSSFGGPGFLPTGAIGGWSPGNTPRRLPNDMGRYLKKGSDLVMQIHYHPSGKAERDQTKVGIYFVEKPKNVVAGIWAANYQMDIPAGESNYRMRSSYTLPEETMLVGIVPHMHLIGKSMRAEAVLPDGSRKPLISIPRWNYNWQDEYYYREPIQLPRGTRLEVEAAYDNSADNPANPNRPPKRVTWGEETTDEMFYCFFLVATKEPAKLLPVIFDNLRHDIQQPRKVVKP